MRSPALLEAQAGRNELLVLGSPSRLQGNAQNCTKLFGKSHSKAASSPAQIIRNPLTSVSQGLLHTCPLQEGTAFQYWKPPGALTSAVALQGLQSIQLPMEKAQCGNIKINPPNYVSKIITTYTVTLGSENGEASFHKEPQTESIAGMLPCRSELVLELTGQRDGVSSCLFTP